MPRAVAAAINPLITEKPGGVFYECDAFDPVARVCTAHDTRPQICSGFPWYTEPPYSQAPDWKPQADTLYSWRRCSFWADVPRETWPDDVQPATYIPLENVA